MKITYRLVPSTKFELTTLGLALQEYKHLWPSVPDASYCVIVGPENKFKAREILGNSQKPYTSNSNINVFQPRLLYIVDHTVPWEYWAIANRVELEQLIRP